jgi:hypothetical protein
MATRFGAARRPYRALDPAWRWVTDRVFTDKPHNNEKE